MDTASTFGSTYAFDPLPPHPHTHTIVFLHGRGSTGEEFADELFEAFPTDSASHLQQRLPTWRWVFPSSGSTYSTTFQEYMPSWFEASSLSDPTIGQGEQMAGLRQAVEHVREDIEQEIRRLGGARNKVFLGGISQGGAVAMWTMLNMGLGKDGEGQIMGGLVVVSSWLPLAEDVARVNGIGSNRLAPGASEERDEAQVNTVEVFVERMLARSLKKTPPGSVPNQRPVPEQTGIPAFFGHGTDDAYVDVALGRQASETFKTLICNDGNKAVGVLQWREYIGADQEGHWLKIPEELNDIIEFLEQHSGGEGIFDRSR